jgi:hypothetical protein
MKPDGEFEPEQLEQFIDHLKSGKVQPFMRSMALPKKQDSLPVKKIVANNYDAEMHKVNKSGFEQVSRLRCCKIISRGQK